MNRKAFLSTVVFGSLGVVLAAWRRCLGAKGGPATVKPSRMGMYYTPSMLINQMLVCDPACGSGGFLASAHEQVARAASVG